MKKIFSIILFSLLVQMVWSQSGEGYDPENPADPNVYYTMTLEASPYSGGTLSPSGRQKLSAGQSTYISASPRLGYEFKQWMMGDVVVSTDRSFYYTMPENNAVLTAYFEWNPKYDPQNPDDPAAEGYSHRVNVYANPSTGGYFNSSSFTLVEGQTTNIYAYPREGYRFESWMCNGEVVSTDNPLTIKMGTSDISYVATFAYNPVSPSEPSPNMFNAATGEAVIDNFTSGSLNNAIYTLVGSDNYSQVQSITIIGQMQSSDFGFAYNYRNCSVIDLSRTTGYMEIPSWSFEGAEALTKIMLPINVEAIGYNAFSGCKSLKDIYIYATVPPTLADGALNNLDKSVTVYVPSSAVSLYKNAEGWNNLTIKSLDINEKSITVNLPNEDGRYKNMTLELQNVQSKQVYKYLVTDRNTYTFYSLVKNTVYNVYLKTSAGVILAEIDNVMLEDDDLTVNFSSIKTMYDVTLSVRMPDGNDVTSDCTITWLDEQGNYICQGNKVSDLLSGTGVQYRVKLGKELAMEYVQPTDVSYDVKDENNNIVFTLSPIKQITMTGRIVDAATKLGISNATVSISQTLNGKYSKTIIVKTDTYGNYTATVYNAPTSLAVSAYDYVNQTIGVDIDPTAENVNVDNVSMSSIIGVTINVNLTYTPSVLEGETAETQSFYDDYQNVAYSIYNITTGQDISQISVRYPQLVVLDGAKVGDKLRITAKSKKDVFMPISTEAIVDSVNRMNVILPIIEYGGIMSSFESSPNSQVVGVLYDDSGSLIASYDYDSNANLTIKGLKDGEYTLVTMGKDTYFNSIYRLSRFAEIGMIEGIDYVSNGMAVKTGVITSANAGIIPKLDTTKYKYIGEGTSFSVNKTSIVAGNYLTFSSIVDFYDEYGNSITDVELLIDIPETAFFVENSLLIGNGIGEYTIENNRVVIPVKNYQRKDKIRFCVIPTEQGSFAPSAILSFVVDGEKKLVAIGAVNYTVEEYSITVPSVVAKTTVPVSGTAIEGSIVEIYDEDILIGQTTSLANGTWSVTCELNEPYNLSTHSIYAKVKTKGLELQSETKDCMYDINTIEAKSVTMSFYNGWLKKNVEVNFDLQNKTIDASSYMFYTTTDITFAADLTNNDTTVVSDVIIRVYTDQNNWRNLNAAYNAKTDRWVAVSQFSSSELPVGVDVVFASQTKILVDRKPFDDVSYKFNQSKIENVILQDSINALESESVQIEQIGQETQETIDSILESLNMEDLTDEESNELISQLLSVAGYTISAEDLEGNVPDLSDEELEVFLQNLIEECDSLLETHDDGMDIYLSNVYDLISFADSLINDDLLIDIEESFSSIGSDTILIENGDTIISIQRTDLADFNVPKIDSTQISILPLTDGNFATIYFDDENIYIVDSINGNVWAIKGISADAIFDSEFASARARIQRAKVSSDIIDNLKKAGDTLEKIAARLSEIGSSLSAELKNNIDNLEKFIKDLGKEADELVQLSQTKAQKLAEVQQKLSTLKNKKVYRGYLQQQIDALEAESRALANDIKRLDKLKSNTQARITKLKSTRMAKVALLSQVTDYVLLANNARKLITYIWKGISDYVKWSAFIDTILPCENDYQNAHNLKYMATDARDAYVIEYSKAAGLSGLSTFIAGFMTFNKAAQGLKYVFKLGIGILNDFLDNTSQSIFNNALNASKQKYAYYTGIKDKLKCKKDDEKCPRCGKNPCECKDKCPICGHKPCICKDKCPVCGKKPCVCEPPKPQIPPIHDPSGYVYEGVSSNRLQSVTATAYYMETTEDMYGVIHEEPRVWDAEEYAQENPLFTDEYGMYRWDVPKGLWQVKFEKDGYETTYSEWLPVPPPQLEVNIGMVQTLQPEVKQAHVYKDGIEVEFDKYMQPALLNTDNILVSQNGKYVDGEIKLLNEETAYNDENVKYASTVRFIPTTPFTASEVMLTVSNRVKSYAGLQMQDTYQQTFDIEQELTDIVVDSILNVPYESSQTIIVKVLPVAASAGKTIRVTSSSSMIVSVETESYILDNNGMASINVTGELPGSASLMYCIDGYGLKAQTIVKVDNVSDETVATPTASIASGSIVEKGTAVALSCATEGATIYYTLDGSCPCDVTDVRKVYDGTPIIINESVTIKAMATAPDMYESDVAVFTYIVENPDGINDMTLDENLMIYPLPVHDKLNVTAGGKIIKGITVASVNGITVASVNKSATKLTLDVSAIPSGVYIVNVVTEDGTYTRKIRKEN